MRDFLKSTLYDCSEIDFNLSACQMHFPPLRHSANVSCSRISPISLPNSFWTFMAFHFIFICELVAFINFFSFLLWLSAWPELFENIGHDFFLWSHMVGTQQMFMKEANGYPDMGMTSCWVSGCQDRASYVSWHLWKIKKNILF